MGFSIGRLLSTTVAVVVGLVVLADIFITHWANNIGAELVSIGQPINSLGYLLVSWTAIVAAFALLLGFYNVVTVHFNRVLTRQKHAFYSLVLLVSLLLTLAVGFFSGPNSPGSRFIFTYILQPLEATFFSLLALFIATAAFRAFRIRNLETFFFVLFAVIVLLGQVPLGIYLWTEFPVIKAWILNVPALAGVRGILLGVALGTIATGLRVLLGTDRPYAD